MSNRRFTEIAVLWAGKKSLAQGRINTACPVVLEPGMSISIQEIKYKEKPSGAAPRWKIVLAAGGDETGPNSDPFGQSADSDEHAPSPPSGDSRNVPEQGEGSSEPTNDVLSKEW